MASGEATGSGAPVAPRHLVDLRGLDRRWVDGLFDTADELRAVRKTPGAPMPLVGRTAALVFHKPSLRTRVGFTAGMHELGGDVVELTRAEINETGRDSVPDIAHILSGMCDVIVIRTFAHSLVQTMAEHATVPVINALTDYGHPCQVLSDLYTLKRRGVDLDDLHIAWVGDGNNVLHSWLEASLLFRFTLTLAVPEGFEPDGGLFLAAEKSGRVRRVRTPAEAVRGANVVYTDTWTSMGHEVDADWRRVAFAGYQVDERLMELASPDAVFMHCLPAHRGEEVSAAVIDGARSIVVEQAENKLHLQKAVLAELVARD